MLSVHRYGFNGHENTDEIFNTTGTAQDFGARMYDNRLGRFMSSDPWEDKYAWQTPYAYFKNSPIKQIDWKGYGDNDDKFYNEKGDLVFDDGVGDDNYIVSQSDYDNAVCDAGNDCSMLSKALKNKGLKAYSSSHDAVIAWSSSGYNFTKNDPLYNEAAAGIFNATMSDGSSLYVLGSTVTGNMSKDLGHRREVNPFESKAIVGKYDLMKENRYKWVYSISREYGENDWKPLAIKMGWMENPITHEGFVLVSEQIWKNTGFAHTHPPGDDNFSAPSNPGETSIRDALQNPIFGDIGFAIRGFDVYLVSTTYLRPVNIYYLSGEVMKNRFYPTVKKAIEGGRKERETIKIEE